VIGDSAFELPGRPRRMVLSLAPLIDVTFILLIFFMLVTQFTRLAPVDASLGEINQSAQAETSPDGGAAADSRLQIHAGGVMELDGEALDGIGDLIEAVHRKGAVARRASSSDQLPVLSLEPDGDVDLQLLIDALTSLSKAPGFAVRIAIPKEDTPAP